jgi:hypothetical protein
MFKVMNMIKNEKGVALVAAIAAMVFSALFVTVVISMQVYNTSQLDQSLASIEVYANAQGIANAYRKTLEGDTDWSDNTTSSSSVGSISYTINIDSAATDEITYTITSTKTPAKGPFDVSRNVTQTVERASPALQNFAVFTSFTGARLRLMTTTGSHTTVTGNIYGGGGGDVDVSNTQTGGVFFIRATETFTADAGTKRPKTLAAGATPTFPVIDDSTYQTTMNGYDTQLATLSGTANYTVNNTNFIVQAANPRCVNDVTYGVVCDFTQFLTQGALVNITGNGTIRCSTQCALHNGNQTVGNTLNVTPDNGGSITFLAVTNIAIGRSDDDTIININTSSTGSRTVNFYSQARTATASFITIAGQTTNLGSSTNQNSVVNLYSRRRITFNDGAQLLGKQNLLFIDNAANFSPLNSITNNFIQIIGDSTKGRATLVEGALISSGCRNTADCISMATGFLAGVYYAQFNGLMYHYDSGDVGECDIDDAQITGAIVCSRMQGNAIARSSITWDPDVLPSPVPAGLNSSVRRKFSTGDGL